MNNVEFISYSDEYNESILTVKIDGKEVRFGHHFNCWNPVTREWTDGNFNIFWHTGGGYRSNVVARGWQVDLNYIPHPYLKYANELKDILNNHVDIGKYFDEGARRISR